MSSNEKLLMKVLSGRQDASVQFSELQRLLALLGFECRIKGDHFIYTNPDVEEIINIQPVNGKAKPYQVKQVRYLILKYKLGGGF